MKKRLEVEYTTEEGLEHFIGMAGYDNIKVTVLPEQEYYFCQYKHCGRPNLGDSNYCKEHSQWMWGAMPKNIAEKNKRIAEQESESCECKNPRTFFDGGLGHKCIDCLKPLKPKKKIEKLDYNIFNKVDVTVSEEGLRRWMIDKINEIIDRIE